MKRTPASANRANNFSNEGSIIAGFPLFAEERARIAPQSLDARDRVCIREAAADAFAHGFLQGRGFVSIHDADATRGVLLWQ
jgi:hypothetical protein